ncbi:MAG: penicillin-binding protein 2 [Lachnospiraceae bacterium]|nr:penicillin-binding protein 2 [Lachnospiraceae bacterium]
MQARFLLVFCFVLVALIILAFRVIFLRQKHGVDYSNAVLSHQSYVNNNIPYERGEIKDRNGAVLAKNVVTYNVILDPSVVNANGGMYVDPTVSAITKAFDINGADVRQILKDEPESKYYILLKDRPYEEVSRFKELQEENHKVVKGVWFETIFTRVYPYGSLASHVIGFVNSDQSVGGGIEYRYNNYLVGKAGRESGYYDNELNLIKKTWPAEDGDTIISTIDIAVQTAVEKHIKEFNERIGCENIGVIVMNPNNGEIYAMASNEGFDLNNPWDLTDYLGAEKLAEIGNDESALAKAREEMWRNFCIRYTFEPGSTFKCVTVASALEEGVATPESTYWCSGIVEMDTFKIHCNARHETVTLEQSLMRSCNMAMIDIASKLGRTTFRTYQDRFGFGYATGIDLPAEEDGIVVENQKLNEVELATSSFGQGFNVTMVQMAAAYSSIVNGGYYYTPHVVSKIINSNGATVYEAKNTISARTVSKSTADFIRKATLKTVEEGTAKPARVKGYLVGGKTGTAQKGIRAEGKYIVSFIGSVPADNPQVVIYVVIDEVHSETLYKSSQPATELTSQILQDILPRLGLYPSEGEIDYGVPLETDNEIAGEGVEEPGDKKK